MIIRGDDKASKAFHSAEKSASGFGKAMGDATKLVAGFAAVAGAATFAKAAVGAASDLNETVSKTRAVFGSASIEIEKFGSGAAKAIGQSKKEALDAASTYGNLFRQIGIGTDQAAKMSIQMTQLASDFASFHNADITQVIQAQTAAFRGEYDALQRFVPTINAAAVEQRALADSGKSTAKELTAAEKAAATYTLILEGSGEASGDFARTADGLANTQRTLSAQWKDAQAVLGAQLLPAVLRVTSAISDGIGIVTSATSAFSKFFGAGTTQNVTSYDDAMRRANSTTGLARETYLKVAEALQQQEQKQVAVAKAAEVQAQNTEEAKRATGDFSQALKDATTAATGFNQKLSESEKALQGFRNVPTPEMVALRAEIAAVDHQLALDKAARLDAGKAADAHSEALQKERDRLQGQLDVLTTNREKTIAAGQAKVTASQQAQGLTKSESDLEAQVRDTTAELAGQGKLVIRPQIDTSSIDEATRKARELVRQIQEVEQDLGPEFGGSLSGIGSRQHGGPVSAGRPYIVGERGPELFFPRNSGYVAPATFAGAPAGRGGGEVHNHYHIAEGATFIGSFDARVREQILALVRDSEMGGGFAYRRGAAGA